MALSGLLNLAVRDMPCLLPDHVQVVPQPPSAHRDGGGSAGGDVPHMEASRLWAGGSQQVALHRGRWGSRRARQLVCTENAEMHQLGWLPPALPLL